MRRRSFVQLSAGALASASLPFVPALLAAVPAVAADIPAVTGNGKAIVLRRAEVAELRAALTGPLLLRGDEGYDQARRVWNASVDRRPALIARCRNGDDVVKAVQFARSHSLLVSVKCGGHSSSGNGTCNDGLMLDLSQMRSVVIDPVARTAVVDGGALLGDLDNASLPHGLATTTGTVSHTGVGGLTLGGGMGNLGRRFGLTIDNLLAADVVTADGKRLHASATDNPDLFWALRGGGGNFGVVTSFTYRLHPFAGKVYSSDLVFPWPVAKQVLDFMGDYGPTLPDAAYFTPVLASSPNGRILVIATHHTDSAAGAEAAIAPLHKFGPVNHPTVAETPYAEMQKRHDKAAERLIYGYLKSGFVIKLDPQFNAAIIDAMEDPAAPGLPVTLVQAGGAIARVDSAATAFPHRDAANAVLFNLTWTDPAKSDAVVQWARSAWKRIEPSMRGTYSNFTAVEDAQDRLRDTFGPNLERLQSLKKKYDPTNLFRLNVNLGG
jgi:FAD/FMN-containing dehydrogenase